MDIKSIAWEIAVERIILPPKIEDSVLREIQLKNYVESVYAEQDKIIQDFNDVLSGLNGFVLINKECSDEMAEVIAGVARVCGGGADDIYNAVVKQAMVEVGGGEKGK